MFEFAPLIAASSQSPLAVGSILFTQANIVTLLIWAILVFFGAYAIQDRWLDWRTTRWRAAQPFILLAVDIPREHEQSIKAVEQIFVQLWGSWRNINLADKWLRGKFQLPFAMELVSISGYIQFLIHTPEVHRDHVEAAIYAQYPAVDIIEVEDYVGGIPERWPAKGWEMWGTEFELKNPEMYPIRTYTQFEHQLAQKLVDPMAALLEILSSCRPGEQVWLQWVITPIPDTWIEEVKEKVKVMIGQKTEETRGLLGKLFSLLSGAGRVTADILSQGLGLEQAESPTTKKELDQFSMFRLTPGETEQIKAIQAKATKPAFKTKVRLIYAAPEEIFLAQRGVSGVIGAMRQFSELSLNQLKPARKTMTRANYFLVERRLNRRRNKLLKAYRLRHQSRGLGVGYIMNIEELATMWHFPTQEVEAARVKRAEGRKAEPPVELPVEGSPFEPSAAATPADRIAVPLVASDDSSHIEASHEIPTANHQPTRSGPDRVLSPGLSQDNGAPPENLPV